MICADVDDVVSGHGARAMVMVRCSVRVTGELGDSWSLCPTLLCGRM